MAQSLVMAGEILRAAHVMACSAPRSIHKNRRGSRWRASRPVAIETMRLGGIAHNFWGLIGSVVAAVLPTTREIFEPTVRLYGAIRRNCQGVNAVSWQNFVPRAGVRYGDDKNPKRTCTSVGSWIKVRCSLIFFAAMHHLEKLTV